MENGGEEKQLLAHSTMWGHVAHCERRTGHRAYHRALINSLYRELYPAQNILRPQRLLPVLCGWWWMGHLWPVIKAYCAGKESDWGQSSAHSLPPWPGSHPAEDGQSSESQGHPARWTLSKAAGQSCEHLLWWLPVYCCCCLELGNAFFTLSGSRAKAIYNGQTEATCS